MVRIQEGGHAIAHFPERQIHSMLSHPEIGDDDVLNTLRKFGTMHVDGMRAAVDLHAQACGRHAIG